MSDVGLPCISHAEDRSYHLKFLSLCLLEIQVLLSVPSFCKLVLWRSASLHMTKCLCALFSPIYSRSFLWIKFFNYYMYFVFLLMVFFCWTLIVPSTFSIPKPVFFLVPRLHLYWICIFPRFKLSRLLFGHEIF